MARVFSMSAKKPTPSKPGGASIASFFSKPAPDAGVAKRLSLGDRPGFGSATMPSGKLDFAAAPDPANAAADAAPPDTSDAIAKHPREPLAAVVDGNGGVSAVASSRRDSDPITASNAPLGSNAQSPAASVGDAYHTPAFAPRPAAREAVDADVTPTAGADARVRTPTVANERPVPRRRPSGAKIRARLAPSIPPSLNLRGVPSFSFSKARSPPPFRADPRRHRPPPTFHSSIPLPHPHSPRPRHSPLRPRRAPPSPQPPAR